MSTVIGLRSGKEFVVEEKFYPFTHSKTKVVTTLFISVDRKRIITIPPVESPIEFFDESADEEFVKTLEESGVDNKPEEGVFNDPNIR